MFLGNESERESKDNKVIEVFLLCARTSSFNLDRTLTQLSSFESVYIQAIRLMRDFLAFSMGITVIVSKISYLDSDGGAEKSIGMN